MLETSSKSFESIQRLTNWNEENITGVFECEKVVMLVCVLSRVFCLCPVFLAVLVHDDWMLIFLDVVEA